MRKGKILLSLAGILLMLVGLVITRPLTSEKRQYETKAAVIATLPQPQNVKVYPDDQLATLTWTAPINANTQNIVGYYITWGKHGGPMTGSKQTIHTITQIQPLQNGVTYDVQVQAVQGSYIKKPTTSEQGGSDTYAVANGNVSPAVTLTVIPTDARVAVMKQRLTAFFDDFNNLSAGALDELKWNHATTACVKLGEDGQFINSQFHAHNATSSTCDRDGNVSRPRAVFDISGRTEANPGVIEFDIDGVSQPRDVWYIDIIPTDVRKNGIPLDVTSHNDLFDADSEDPGRMIRISQYYDKILFHFYDQNKNPGSMTLLSAGMPCQISWQGASTASFDSCDMTKKNSGLSPLADIPTSLAPVVPNVRRHWRIELSPQKVKLFIDSTLIGSATPPSFVGSVTKYIVHSTLFSYNTGKQYVTVAPTSSMLHWDNFGFTGPAPTTIVHNYLDGGANGDFPLISRGTVAHPVPAGDRLTKIPIPDPIGSPVQARLMFTMQPFSSHNYTWSSNQTITINDKIYPFPNPQLNLQVPSTIAGPYIAHATGIVINASDLKQGMNIIKFGLGEDIINVHIELEYSKTNTPSYTPPKTIFASASFTNVITPVMRMNDMYWFVEQDMGLPKLSGSTSPMPSMSASNMPMSTVTPLVPTTSGDTKISLTLFLHGIGKGGDNVSGRGSGNSVPLHTSRTVTVALYNNTNNLVVSKQGSVLYNATSGAYGGVISLGFIAPGLYTGKLSVPNYLTRAIPGIISLQAGGTFSLEPQDFIAGDSNSDNKISILDYNIIIDCFSDLSPAKNCADTNKKSSADLTDDGKVNQNDYNLFLREISVQVGI